MNRLLPVLFLFLLFPQIAFGAAQQIVGFELCANGEQADNFGTFSIQSTTKRTGNCALRINPTTTATGEAEVGCLSATGVATSGKCNISTAYIRMYFNYATKASSGDEQIFKITRQADSTVKGSVTLTSTGVLQIYNNAGTLVATGATVLSSGTWYRIEYQASNGTSSTYTVKIDGTTELTGTMNQGANNFGSIQLGKTANLNGNTVDYFFDDVLIDDAAFPGAGQVTELLPNADGTTQQWTAGTNASNYLEVDENSTSAANDGDTTYLLKSATGSQQAMMNFTDTGTAGISGTIKAVKLYVAGRSSVGTAAFFPRISSGGTSSDASSTAVGTSYANFFKFNATDPNTSTAWTTTTVDAVQGGCVDTGAITTVRCTAVSMMVDWQAAATGNPTQYTTMKMIGLY